MGPSQDEFKPKTQILVRFPNSLYKRVGEPDYPNIHSQIPNATSRYPKHLDALHVKVAVHRGPVHISRFAGVLVALDALFLTCLMVMIIIAFIIMIIVTLDYLLLYKST